MYLNDANGDVFRRLEQAGFDFSIEHPVDFYAVYATEEEAGIVAQQYVQDWKNGQEFKNIETRPYDQGGRELQLVPIMIVSLENIVTFERQFAERTSHVDGYLDGWGVFSN